MKTAPKLTLSSKLVLSKETVKSFRVHTGLRTGGAPLKCPTATSITTCRSLNRCQA
jgi:hypothetical protein